MQRAFSLVELSIVIVILGLLVGGVMGGQTLIRGAKLRGVMSEVELYIGATSNFLDQYGALPGDMPNATSYWGAQNASPATCRTTASTGQATCDGNGDNIIHTMDGGTTYSEFHRYWQHLANAGLIGGKYSGVGGAAGVASVVPGTNAPLSKLGDFSGYGLNWYGTLSSAAGFYDGDYGHAFLLGRAGGTGMPDGGAMRADEMENIDRKMDDGLPAFGSVVSLLASSRPACSTSDTAAAALYNVSNTTNGCAAVFKSSF